MNNEPKKLFSVKKKLTADEKKKLEAIEKKLKADMPDESYSKDTSRGFELTSIKAAYVIERLNEAFGLLGEGWKYTVSSFKETMQPDQQEIMEVGANVKFQYQLPNGEWSEEIPHVGGKRVIKNNITDARKSAITDALTKIAGMLGVGHLAFKGKVKVDQAGNVNVGKSTGTKAETAPAADLDPDWMKGK